MTLTNAFRLYSFNPLTPCNNFNPLILKKTNKNEQTSQTTDYRPIANYGW